MFYILRAAPHAWGDYGKILVHGISNRRTPRDCSTEVLLRRGGPGVAPMTIPSPSDIIISSSLHAGIAASGLSGARFRPVRKVHVVRCKWSRHMEMMGSLPELPSSGEPEDLLDQPHDSLAEKELGDLWELVVDRYGIGSSRIVTRRPLRYEVHLAIERGVAPDFFRPNALLQVAVSARAREWLEPRVGPEIEFQPVVVT